MKELEVKIVRDAGGIKMWIDGERVKNVDTYACLAVESTGQCFPYFPVAKLLGLIDGTDKEAKHINDLEGAKIV